MIFKNIFKSTVRHLLRDKIYLLVSVLSLSAGLICCLFVFKYVQNELSYDKFHEEADRIYRIEYEAEWDDGYLSRFANLHGSVRPDWLSTVPEIELKTRFAQHADLNVTTAGNRFEERDILAADSSFFSLFTFHFIEGNPTSALRSPNSAVISQTTAQKYFNTTDAIGETLNLRFQDREVLLTITGITEDVPSNAHFTFDIATSAKTYEELYGYSINNIQQAYTYIRLFEGASADQVETKLNKIHNQREPDNVVTYHLRALTDIHLYSSARGELAPNSSVTYIYIFSLIALIILAIACVNFTTLATARSLNRTNEIGICKVYGALRGNLMISFFFEAVLLASCGLVLAYFLAWEFLPRFNSLAGKSITFAQLITPSFLLTMILVTIVTGCAAASYPALILTKYKPVSLLLNHSSKNLKGDAFWKTVIVMQFAATIMLIFASYIVHQQLDFIQNKDLGFDKEQIITFPNYFGDNWETFVARVNEHPDIERVTASSYIPGVSKTSGTAVVEAEGRTDALTFDWISVNHQYLDTYDINLVEGRNFSKERPADTTKAFLINETAAKMLGWEEPLGKSLHTFDRDGQVIGVVADFNLLSLHKEISPLILFIYEQYYFTISAKLRSVEQLPETISYIENIWQDLMPGTPFTYDFVDDQFAAVYESEQKARSLFFVFAMLAISIAMLGLFSFASFSMRQKRREIGIRKVLGASLYDLLRLFYSGYFNLLMVASVIAFPIAYIGMSHWLQNFSYRVEIGADTVLIPLVITVAIILLSVSYQTLKEALRNPAETIRAD